MKPASATRQSLKGEQSPKNFHNTTAKLLLAAIVLLSVGFMLARLDRPFERNAEGCGAFFGLLARNYFRYDFSTTLGVPVISMGKSAPPVFYANHPPTVSLLIAVVYATSGYTGDYETMPDDWLTRLPAATFTLLCITAVPAMLWRRAGPATAVIAAALLASVPITLRYGAMPDVINSQLIFFCLLTVAAYERFCDRPNWRTLTILCLAFLAAAMTDWPAFFLLPVLGVHFLCTHRIRQWRWISAFAFIAVAVFAAQYAYLSVAQHDWWWMISLLKHRAFSSTGDESGHFTPWSWMCRAWEYGVGGQTAIVILLALLWLLTAAWRNFSGQTDRLAGLLLAWAVVHIVVGRQGVYQHEWWWWPLTPGAVIAAALASQRLLSLLQKQTSHIIVNLLAGILLTAFAGWNVRTVAVEQATVPPIAQGSLNYTPQELGQLIRQCVKPDAAVMLAESDRSLALWYYADRAMKRWVWEATSFQRRLDDQIVDLCFDIPQPWPGPVDAMIIPRAYLAKGLQPFVSYLDARYPRIQTDKFIIYDLR